MSSETTHDDMKKCQVTNTLSDDQIRTMSNIDDETVLVK